MGIKCEEVRKRHTFVGLMGRFCKACRHIVCDMQPVLTFVPRRWFADQIGAFEIHPSVDGKKSLKQMVAELPIGWSDQGTRGPMTLIGMREWQDIQAGVEAIVGTWGVLGRGREGPLKPKCCLQQQFPCCHASLTWHGTAGAGGFQAACG